MPGSSSSPEKLQLYRKPCLPVVIGEPGQSGLSVQRWQQETRDWRKLSSQDIASHLEELRACSPAPICPRLYSTHLRLPQADAQQKHCQIEGLAAAVSVGVLQACREGRYWSPEFEDASSMECSNVRQPMSRIFSALPDLSKCEVRGSSDVNIHVEDSLDTLEMCERLAREPGRPRVALVRFTDSGSPQALQPTFDDMRQAQLYLRTTYLHALSDMDRHLHTRAEDVLTSGSIIHTADVSILRGPIEDGAAWISNPVRIDILTAGLQRRPAFDKHEQYGRITEKAAVARTVDYIFGCAVSSGIDILVFPPLGVNGAQGCYHPAADAGDLLRKAILAHSKYVPRVCVCQEFPGQVQGSWQSFAGAVMHGRPVVPHQETVSMSVAPFLHAALMASKQRKVAAAALSARGPRRQLDMLSKTGHAISQR